MKINPFPLQFSDSLETDFREYFDQKSLKQGRIAIISVIALYLIWGIADINLAPSSVIKLILIIRYGVIVPFLAGILIGSFSRHFKPWLTPVWCVIIMVTCGSLFVMSIVSTWHGSPLEQNSLHISLILAFIYVYTFNMVRFSYALILGVSIIIFYNLAGIFLLKFSAVTLFTNNFYLVSANIIGLCACYQIEFFLRKIFWQTRQLEIEKQNSEKLLLNILPETIADRLKQDHSTIADSFAQATVLFADIVGFTELSHQFSPIELVNLLNEIFSEFDYLAEEYQLEKIKTIGDAYMIVGGLPHPRSDHAQAVATMALKMLETIDNFNQKNNYNFQIRIGINSGEVVAGVIGVKKFIYDLWGDTVNIASRMESHGVAGKIQITCSTYELLKGQFLFEERGFISVKGKGKMKTFFLLAPSTFDIYA